MARTDEAEAFFHAVYSAVQEIPNGKVTSYGHIAKLIGTRMCVNYLKACFLTGVVIDNETAQRPRQVGVCLKHLSSDPASRFNGNNVPWQRVINSKGIISPRGHPSGAADQATELRAEGVIVNVGNMGELQVDFGVYGWFPHQLPSEMAAGFDDPGEED